MNCGHALEYSPDVVVKGDTGLCDECGAVTVVFCATPHQLRRITHCLRWGHESACDDLSRHLVRLMEDLGVPLWDEEVAP